MELVLKEHEKRRLVIFAENVMKSGHWGNAALEIPEERILLDAIQKPGDAMEISVAQAEMIFRWFLSSTDHGAILLPDDVSIIEKLVVALYRDYENKKLLYLQELNRMTTIMNEASGILSRGDLDRSLDHIARIKQIEQDSLYLELKRRIGLTDDDEEKPGGMGNDAAGDSVVKDAAKSDSGSRGSSVGEGIDARELLRKSDELAKKLKKK